MVADDKKKHFQKGFGKHTGPGLFLTHEILAITGIAIAENSEPGNGVQFEIVAPGKDTGLQRLIPERKEHLMTGTQETGDDNNGPATESLPARENFFRS